MTTEPQAQTSERVPDLRNMQEASPAETLAFLRERIRADAEKIRALEAAVRDAISALDDALGDTDPVIDAEATDEEVRDEQPVFWACQRLSAALAATQSPRSEAGEDVTFHAT